MGLNSTSLRITVTMNVKPLEHKLITVIICNTKIYVIRSTFTYQKIHIQQISE